MPSKPIRGAMIALPRRSTEAPDDRVTPFGKFTGWLYREGYRQWAKENPNHYPDLAAFAAFWRRRPARRPPPLRTSEHSAGRWRSEEEISDMEAELPPDVLLEIAEMEAGGTEAEASPKPKSYEPRAGRPNYESVAGQAPEAGDVPGRERRGRRCGKRRTATSS